MLNYTSQEALDYLLKGCEDVWDKGKDIHSVPWVTTTSVTISPGDYPVECYGKNCQKLFEPNKHPYGEASKIMGMFVKKFAMEVKAPMAGEESTVFALLQLHAVPGGD